MPVYGFEKEEDFHRVWRAIKEVEKWMNSPEGKKKPQQQLPPWVKIVRITGSKVVEQGGGTGSGSGGTECPLTYYPAVFVYKKCGKPVDGEECRAVALNGETLKFGKVYGGVISEIIRGLAVVEVWVSGEEEDEGSGSGSGGAGDTFEVYEYSCSGTTLLKTTITYQIKVVNGDVVIEEV